MLKYPLGFSAYVSHFESQKSFLESLPHQEVFIFTSLHMPEEMNTSYVSQVSDMLSWLSSRGFKVIGDISRRSLEVFGASSISELATRLGLHMVRIDYGFTLDEMIDAAKCYPLVFNASTVDLASAQAILDASGKVMAIHNFYPREHTGLSMRQFREINHKLHNIGIDVLAFVPNHKTSRGPVYAGLPTVEHTRYQNPWLSYLELSQEDALDGLLFADLAMDIQDLDAIMTYEKERVITLPTDFEASYNHLIGQTYTIRIDSPDALLRLQESREFATPGECIAPYNTLARPIGAITCDNMHYGRYSGEIQILKEGLPLDYRVNVIGSLQKDYLDLCHFVPNGSKIRFK
ncbi:MAG: MupG family TIM beta-alpha barrel fold protein [Cellulosilyticaceae bacterium]